MTLFAVIETLQKRTARGMERYQPVLANLLLVIMVCLLIMIGSLNYLTPQEDWLSTQWPAAKAVLL